MADEKTEHCNLTRKFVWPQKMQTFMSHFVFRRQPAELLISKNIRQMEAGQNNKYDITKTLGLHENKSPQVYQITSGFFDIT